MMYSQLWKKAGLSGSALCMGMIAGSYGSNVPNWRYNGNASCEEKLSEKNPSTLWTAGTTTKHWHFYKGKMTSERAKGLQLFQCADTPIAKEISQYLGVPLSDMTVKKFADGETSININEHVRGGNVYLVSSTTNVDRVMELLLSISAFRRASARKITAVIPFYGYARQDRQTKGREPIAAADIARMLEVVGVDHVVTINLHSAQIEGFFKPQVTVDNLQAFPVGSVYFSELQLPDPIVIAPHSSAVNRAAVFRDILSRTLDKAINVAFVIRKHRIDNNFPGELVGDVTGKDCIIVDNLVDTGSTLMQTAKLLKTKGARSVSAFCVHGRFSGDATSKLQECADLDLLVRTNTIPIAEDKLETAPKIVTLSVAPFLAEVISCIHTKSSVVQATKLK